MRRILSILVSFFQLADTLYLYVSITVIIAESVWYSDVYHR